ncbi:aminopeptidase N [Thalassomonas actiniarum]|uniref:Aminopeptidase N n=1 Tax=Thalassomonas actiniarum TaxID=485447 RepID=A0AAE9YKK5_9GAMM|nr:aminopeptidase N [Thalassomonas actiniarum]WDD96991.1 aminopeptidase N [Thalassomonas actiniarum]
MSEFTPRYLADYQVSAFTISTIDLTFELDDTATKVTSVMSVKRQGSGEEPLVLDGEHLTLLSVKIDQCLLSASDYYLSATGLEIPVRADEFQLTIVTEINPQDNTALEGLFKSGDAFCTQCEAEGFRRITYYLDRPDVMAVFTSKVIADKIKYPYLLSNGNKIASGELDNGKHFVQWHDPFPKPCYLFALVAGDFDLLQDSYLTSENREVALEIFVDKGNLAKAEHAMASLKNAMAWDEETFSLAYDLDIYMIVAVDFFNMGAMENKGLNVFNSKYVLADTESATDVDYYNIEAVIAHEYFHNWTGNRVTCRDWFQLSLKEGLTVFRDQQFSGDMNSKTVSRIQNVRVLRSQQFAEDAGPMAHPIRPEKVMEMNNFYTLTVYEKGSEVIRMIHTLLGAEGFAKGMALYFERFDGMAVTCDDFVNAMADASKVDLTQFKRWYSQSGTPHLKVSESFDPEANLYHLTISQHNQAGELSSPQSCLHIPVKMELIDADSGIGQQQLLELTAPEQTWTFEHYQAKPVVALLEDFSAPVKVDFEQTDLALEVLMLAASDGFCRWDAGQKLLSRYLHKLVLEPGYALPASLITIFSKILQKDSDPAFTAEQLTLPAFGEVVDQIHQVDPLALVNALKTLKGFLAKGLQEPLSACYHNCAEKTALSHQQAIGNRALKNICLSYLAVLPGADTLVAAQLSSAANMTDTLAALNASAYNNLPAFDSQMSAFESKWHDTPLVVDKWFTINASLNSDDIFERLAALLKHPLFSIKNPNRARALIGAFVSANPQYFHCQSGRGYQFLAEQIKRLNEINPQVASRLITPLIQYKEYDLSRQQLMLEQLKVLRALPQLSKDLLEKLDAALN